MLELLVFSHLIPDFATPVLIYVCWARS